MSKVDVAIIGAGFSGLSAALALREAGRRVLVLEAQQAPGGRVQSVLHPDGHVYENGGQFFEDAMTHLCALVDRYGLRRREVRRRPGVVTVFRGERRLLEGDFLEHGLLERLFSEETDPARSGSLQDWVLSLGLAPDDLAFLRSGCEEVTGRRMEELSFRSFYDCLRRFEGVQDPTEYACVEGLGALAGKMADELGGALRCRCPVTAVDRRDGLFHLESPQGEVTADHVIFAASPAVLGTIAWRAAQDAWLNDHARGFVAGKMTKIVLRYDGAFWVHGDFGAVGRTDAPPGLAVVDASDPRGGLDMLAVFCGGTAATALEGLPEPEVLSRVFDALEPLLGPELRRPLTVVQTRWTDHPWVGGGYATYRN